MTRVERGRGREAPGSVLSSACQGAGRDEARGACAPWSWQGQPRGLPVFGLPAGATARGGLAWHLCLSDGPSRPVSPGLRAGRNAARPRLHPRPPLTATSSHPPTGHSPNIWLVFPASWGWGPGARRSPSAGTVWEAPWGCGNQSVWGRSPARGRQRRWGRRPGAGGGKPLQGARAAKSLPPDLRATLDPRPSVGARSPKAPSPAPISPITGALPTPWGAYSCHSTPPSLSVLFCKMGRPCWCRPRAWGAGEVRRAGPALPRPARLPGAGPSPCLCGYPSAFTSLRPGAAGDTAG